jgi:AraC-like DNA-binding protein
MFVCLFWSTLLALQVTTERKTRARVHLLIFMLASTVLYFGHSVFFNHNTKILPLTDTLYITANLMVYPLYYLYICALTTRRSYHHLRYLLLIPGVVGGMLVGGCYLMMPEEETQQFIELYMYHGVRVGGVGIVSMQVMIHDLCKLLFAFLIPPVLFLGRRHIIEYEQLVNNSYADVEKKSLTIIHYMLIAFIITSVMSFAMNVIGREQFNDSQQLLAIPSTIFSCLLFSIGYIGYRQDFDIEDIEADEQKADEQVTNQPIISELQKRIEQLMEEEQLFRQPNLKIVDLVQKLGTNRSYIYQAINREMGLSFAEYINRMRIEYASQLILQHPDMPVSTIGEQAGFNSSTSFYRNFKLYKGMGPKEYQSSLKDK